MLDAMRITSPRHRLALASALCIAVVALVGCSAMSEQSVDDVLLVSATGDDPGEDAQIIGAIALTDGGCVGLRGDDDLVRFVIWPRGTQLVSSVPLEIRLADSTLLAEGDDVAGAGGYFDDRASDQENIARCSPDDEQVIRLRFEE